jgi:hypothetical protein
VLHALECVAAPLVRHRLFSATAVHLDVMEVERLHSTHPGDYPVGGRKKKAATRWGELVLVKQRVLVTQGLQELAETFDDHARMAALGVRSLVNVPVVRGGVCVGVLNFGFGTDTVEPEQVDWAAKFAPLALGAFQS